MRATSQEKHSNRTIALDTLGTGTPLTMRIVIPAALFLTLGVQTVFSSFFLSVLGLRRR
jgi:Na+-transporting NADH:ubiquinone oxidoreductase subunit NqrD